MMLSRSTPCSSCARPSRARTAVVRASVDGNGSAFADGARVKVTAEVKVFHAPKHPEGYDLQGKEGVIVKNVGFFKEKHLSPNLPYKVQFEIQKDGAPAKLFAHLAEEEIEVIS